MMIACPKCGAYIFVVEFFYSQKGGKTMNDNMVHITIDGKKYTVRYEEPGNGTIMTPESLAYTVSGDNTGGYVVTIWE